MRNNRSNEFVNDSKVVIVWEYVYDSESKIQRYDDIKEWDLRIVVKLVVMSKKNLVDFFVRTCGTVSYQQGTIKLWSG